MVGGGTTSDLLPQRTCLLFVCLQLVAMALPELAEVAVVPTKPVAELMRRSTLLFQMSIAAACFESPRGHSRSTRTRTPALFAGGS